MEVVPLCPSGNRKLAGNWQHFTAKVSTEVLWSVGHSVLWAIAEISETALREDPKAKHWRSPGIRAIPYLLLVATVTHHDVRTTAWGGRAATSEEVPAKHQTLPSPHFTQTSSLPHTLPCIPKMQRFLELGRGRSAKESPAMK